MAERTPDDVTPIVLPTLLGVGPATVHLLEGATTALVDTGPAMLVTLEALEAGFAAAGRRVEDLDLVVVTHHHQDHFGLAGRIAGRAGAAVAAPARAVAWLADYAESRRRDAAFRARALRAHGVPDDVVHLVLELTAARDAWGAPVEVDVPLADGDRIRLGDRTFAVHERPGHSESDVTLLDGDGLLVAGDHLLPRISSNPTMARPLDDGVRDERRNHALADYERSLLATRAQDVDLVLPGHGEPFRGHRELVDRRLAATTRRADEIAAMLDRTPRSVHELARRMWPDRAVPQAALTTSEVTGHLQLLLDDGRAAEADPDAAVARFVARPS